MGRVLLHRHAKTIGEHRHRLRGAPIDAEVVSHAGFYACGVNVELKIEERFRFPQA